MKKLVLSLAVVFAVGMVSCGGNDKKADENCDSTPVETVEETAVVEEETAPAADSQAAPAEEAPKADSAK